MKHELQEYNFVLNRKLIWDLLCVLGWGIADLLISQCALSSMQSAHNPKKFLHQNRKLGVQF